MNRVNQIRIPLDGKIFRNQLIRYSQQVNHFCLLDGEGFLNFEKSKDRIAVAGIGAVREFVIETLPDGITASDNQWCFGAMSYELKDRFEQLHSTHQDQIEFPESHFFIAEVVAEVFNDYVLLQSATLREEELRATCTSILKAETSWFHAEGELIRNLRPDFSKEEYVQRVEQIRKHIARGDIYEMNFCLEFVADVENWNPALAFAEISARVTMPFACLYKVREVQLLSFSPERFISKQGMILRSQPMKGTARRGADESEDALLKQELQQSEKERAENVMIVDLVRNDLSKVAEKGSVEVEELFGVYTFPQVFQMISTIRAQLKTNISFYDIMKALFPMGSMTGAPKIRAMELIEKYEISKRGLYSGSVGCFTPEGNFDFNVVIRSLLYNSEKGKLSYHTGSAITFYSDPEREYEECMLKAKVMLDLCAQSIPEA